MPDEYNYQVVGVGKTVDDALRDAEGKLPFPLKDPIKYAGFRTMPHEELPDGQGYSVVIAYNLPAFNLPAEQQRRGRPGSSVQPSVPVPRRGAGASAPTRLEEVVRNLRG